MGGNNGSGYYLESNFPFHAHAHTQSLHREKYNLYSFPIFQHKPISISERKSYGKARKISPFLFS